jgi:hypothetical protein
MVTPARKKARRIIPTGFFFQFMPTLTCTPASHQIAGTWHGVRPRQLSEKIGKCG